MAKYIAGRVQTRYLAVDVAFVFHDILEHSTVAKRIDFTEVYSAGFVDIYAVDSKHVIRCYGSSTSLNCESNQHHADLVAQSLGIDSNKWVGPD